MRFCRECMRDSHFQIDRADPIFRFQKRRGRHALLNPAPFPLRIRFPPSASDKQAPGPPPRPGAICLSPDALPQPNSTPCEVRRRATYVAAVATTHRQASAAMTEATLPETRSFQAEASRTLDI